MSKRNHNVYFNTHTVSGIILSIGLYIIFFAGSFSLFRNEIDLWQNGNPSTNKSISSIDYNKILTELDHTHVLHGRDIDFKFKDKKEHVLVALKATKDTVSNPKGKRYQTLFINLNKNTSQNATQHYTLGDFLYRLHFLDPFIYPIGRSIAGFMAMFLIFAIVTGIIIHWKKIIPNFYKFNPKTAFKRIWADAHTSLGILGLPFQFVYGLTGSIFLLSTLTLIPIKILYNNPQKLTKEIRPEIKTFLWQETETKKPLPIQLFIKKTSTIWNDLNIKKISISNFGGTNMKYIFSGELETKKRFVGTGRVCYNAYTGKVISKKDPYQLNYIEDIKVFWQRLHFANFGGVLMRIIYFTLGILTCFVIITGILIWAESRNNKTKTPKQRKYAEKVGNIHLAICLSMLPVTALSFTFSRITNGLFENPKRAIYIFYFSTWCLLTLYYTLKKSNYFTNKNSLLLSSILGTLIPIINGFTSGNWIWHTFNTHEYDILTIDLIWLSLSCITWFSYFKIKNTVNQKTP